MTTERKLADSIANEVEDHYFNAGVLASHLMDNPLYTIDRIMEIVAHIVNSASVRAHTDELVGVTSEGLILANGLNAAMKQIKDTYQFESLKLPREPKAVIKDMPEDPLVSYRYSWLHD